MRRSKAPAPVFERTSRRHRHPRYPHERCGAQLIVNEDGSYQQRGMRVRTCRDCRKRIKKEDIV